MKDWLELLNDTKIDLNEYKEEDFNHKEKSKLKSDLRKRIMKKKSIGYKKIVAASVATIALLAVPNLEVIADKLEKLMSKNPIENFENYKDVKANKYRNVVDQSVTNNGLTITINEVIFDNENILVTYTLDNKEKVDLKMRVFIEGKEIDIQDFSGTYAQEDRKLQQMQLKLKEPIKNIGEFNMKILIGGKSRFTQDKIIEDGKWEFNFKASNLEINKDTKKIDLNKVITLKNGMRIYMDKIIITPISTKVEIRVENLLQKDAEQISMSCIVEDFEGNSLEKRGANVKCYYEEQDRYKQVSEIEFKNIGENLDSIKITPIVLFDNLYDKNNSYNKELKEYSFEVNLKK